MWQTRPLHHHPDISELTGEAMLITEGKLCMEIDGCIYSEHIATLEIITSISLIQKILQIRSMHSIRQNAPTLGSYYYRGVQEQRQKDISKPSESKLGYYQPRRFAQQQGEAHLNLLGIIAGFHPLMQRTPFVRLVRTRATGLGSVLLLPIGTIRLPLRGGPARRFPS